MSFRNINVLMTANSSNLRTQLMAAGREIDKFDAKIKAHHAGALSGAKMFAAAGVAAGTVVAAGLAYSVKQAAAFETQMRNVNSISQLSEGQFQALGKTVVNMSKQFPQSAAVMAAGLYDIASSGFQGAEGVKVLSAAVAAASAGMTDTATAAKGITAVLNAYGLEAADATDVSDVLFQTVNLGVVTFEELSSQLGDVVGTAAAAGVAIGDVGAAVAAMTLSGISGAESTTSLNRLLQSLIDPSESLAAALHGLGYESGAQALQVDGLYGVMEKLRVATGGNVTSLLALFPEIRAARGAFALMAAEGENYRKTNDGIADSNNRQGATQRALREQMKAASAQWQLMKNRIDAAAITIGTRLLPILVSAMRGMQRLAGVAGEQLGAAIQALAPFFKAMRDVGADVVDMLGDFIRAARPVGLAIDKMIAGGVITGLNTMATALAAITGFLERNRGAVVALGAVLSAVLLPALLSSAWAGMVSAAESIALGIMYMGDAATVSGAKIAAMGVATNVALLGIGALWFGAVTHFQNAEKSAKAFTASLIEGTDERTLRGLDSTQTKLMKVYDALDKTGKGAGGVGNSLRRALEILPGKDPFTKTRADMDDLVKQMDRNSKIRMNLSKNETAVMDRLSRHGSDRWKKFAPEVEKVARALGVDLTKGGTDGAEAVDKVVAHFRELEIQTGGTAESTTNAVGTSIEAMERLAAATEDARKATLEAFYAATDLFSAFDADAPEKSQEAVTDARERLTDATKDLHKAEQDRAKVRRRSELEPAEERLASAREKVAEATAEVAEAESKVVTNAGQIQQFYTDRIRDTAAFASNVQEAVRRGLDPEFISRTLQEGPEKAGPILETLVSDHSNRLINMVNESEATLRGISTQMAEFSRLTTLAVSSNTDTMVQDLDEAMAIASANLAAGGAETASEIAKAIGVPTEEVRRIAREYGITLGLEVGSGWSSGWTAWVNGWKASDPFANTGGGNWSTGTVSRSTPPIGRATGGRLTGFNIVGENGPELINHGLVHSAGSNATRQAMRPAAAQVTVIRVPQQITKQYAFGDIHAVADVDTITKDAERKQRKRDLTSTGQGGWG